MNSLTGLGAALSVGGVVGYIAGTAVAYPGRAFTLTAVMVGVTLLAVGRSDPAEGTA